MNKILLLFLFFNLLLFSNCTKESNVLKFNLLDQSLLSGKSPGGGKGGVTDIDGNSYDTVRIGSQTWTVQNFKSSKLNDGTPIVQLSTLVPANASTTPIYDSSKNGANTPAFAYYNDKSSYDRLYGKAYNLAAIKTGKLTPPGWHVATPQDWSQLISYTLCPTCSMGGNYDSSGIKLRATRGWTTCSDKGLDSYGFKGLPGGTFPLDGSVYIDMMSYFWGIDPYTTYVYRLDYCIPFVKAYGNINGDYPAAYIRLVKDNL